jgi:hypothetical protein
VIAEAMTNLATHADSATRRRERMVRLDVMRVDEVLRYAAALETTLTGERQRRADFEVRAEGEFHELRLQVRTWQGYAVQVEERRNVLALHLRALLASLQALANSRWWRRRERREAREDVSDWRVIAAQTLAQDEPTPPVVDLDG